MTIRAIVKFKSYKLLEGKAWDGKAAVDRMREWASKDGSGKKDQMDWEKYRAGFTWYDADDQENFGSYKLPHHDIVDGAMVTHQRGVYAAAQRLDSTQMTDSERKMARSHLGQHYKDMGQKPPWEKEKKSMSLNDVFEQARLSGVHYGEARIMAFGSLAELAEQEPEIQKLFSRRVRIKAAPEEIYLFQLQPSTQAMDSYGTRMAEATLGRYVENADEGVPVMNSHRTQRWFGKSELPLGHSFAGDVRGDPADETPMLDRKTPPKDNTKEIMEMGQVLQTWNYLKRDYYPNGQSEIGTNDLINGIESRSVRAISIGFGHDRPKRLQYICGLCGKPIARGFWTDNEDDCHHIPLVMDKGSGLVAFAWVYDAKLYETSTVWAGATPGASVIVEGARMAAQSGALSAPEIEMLEELWSLSLTESNLYVPRGTHFKLDQDQEVFEMPQDAEEKTQPVEGEGQDRATTVLELDLGDFEERLNGAVEALESASTDFQAGLEAARESLEQFDARLAEIEQRQDQLNQAQQETQQDIHAAAVERALEARIRAFGQVSTDPESYRERLSGMTVEQIEAEIAEMSNVTASKFESGRASGGATEGALNGGKQLHAHLYR